MPPRRWAPTAATVSSADQRSTESSNTKQTHGRSLPCVCFSMLRTRTVWIFRWRHWNVHFPRRAETFLRCSVRGRILPRSKQLTVLRALRWVLQPPPLVRRRRSPSSRRRRGRAEERGCQSVEVLRHPRWTTPCDHIAIFSPRTPIAASAPLPPRRFVRIPPALARHSTAAFAAFATATFRTNGRGRLRPLQPILQPLSRSQSFSR